MTISEAKKIIEMCVDAIKKGDGDDAKIYVNKEYVLQILDMVESDNNGITTIPTYPGTYPGNDEIRDKAYPAWPPTWPQVWYKDDINVPDPGPGFEKVPWWVWYKNPMGDFTCDSNSTGSKPQDANIVMTSSDLHKFNESHANPEDYKNVTITSGSTEPTHLFKEQFTTGGIVRDTSEGTHTV